MLHYTPEGSIARVGLNLALGTLRRPWISLRWIWYDTASRELTSWRVRLRLYMWPALLLSRDRHNVVHGYLWERDAVVVDRECMRDMCSDLGIEYTEYEYREA